MSHATGAPTHSTTLATLTSLTPLQKALLGYLARYDGGTRDLYERHLGAWLTWCAQLGVDPLAVERTHLEVYVRERIAKVRPSTIHTEMTPVKGFYDFAFDDGLIDRDPSTRIRLPKVHHRTRVALDRQEQSKLLMVARETSPRHWALISLLGVMGMRISETLSITDQSFTETQQGYQILRWTAKGSKPRMLPLPASVLRALEAAAEASPSGYVVYRKNGAPGDAPLNRHSGTGLVNTVVRRAGLDRKVNPHLLRGSAITHLLDAGVEMRDVANFSGHEDVRTLRRHYDLTKDNVDRSAVHILAARLAS